MRTRPLALSLLLWALIPLTTTTPARAESFWKTVEIAAGIAKGLWDLGSSMVTKSSDYGIYRVAFELERYSDVIDSYDHGSKSSVQHAHWRDIGTGAYHYLTVESDAFHKSSNTNAFEHAFGNCTWICSFTTNPADFMVSGRKVQVVATKYRLRTMMLRTPSSAKLLMDPLPVTAVWTASIPSATMCGISTDVTSATIQAQSYLFDGPILTYPIAQGLSANTPTTYLTAKTDPK